VALHIPVERPFTLKALPVAQQGEPEYSLRVSAAADPG
jgi:hypothetical protein